MRHAAGMAISTVLLTLMLLTSGGLLWYQIQRGPEYATAKVPNPELAGTEAASDEPEAIEELLAVEEYKQITTRPLFAETRRPPAKIEQGQGKIPDPSNPLAARKDGFVLLGVAITESKRKALLRPTQGSPAQYVEEGDVFHGWRVEAVNSDSVTLKSGDQQISIRLKRAGLPQARRPEPPVAPGAGESNETENTPDPSTKEPEEHE